MKRIQIVFVLILIIMLLTACNFEGETTTMDYYSGIQINNEDNCNDLITTLIEDDVFSDSAIGIPTLEDINEVSEIECLRKVDDINYYSIHRTTSNIYVFHFFELVNEDMLLRNIERYSQDISYSDLEILLLNESTIEEVKVFYNDLITYDFDSMTYVSGYISLFSGDVYQLDFSFKDGQSFLINVELHWASEENIYFSMLLGKDLPSNLIHD